MRQQSPRAPLAIAAAFAGVMLGGAISLERFFGVVPCALCLLERWPWRVALVIAVLGLLLPRRLGWFALFLAGLATLAGVGLAFIHVGVEGHLWPSPLPECTTPRFVGGSVAEMLARLPAHPDKPCDAPTYLIPGVPISVAMLNLLASLAYLIATWRTFWRHRRSWQ